MLTFFIPIYAIATLSAFLILNLFTSKFEKRNLLMIAIFIAAFINALPFPLANLDYYQNLDRGSYFL